ncbi:MAG: pyruvate ferredoxin oxidoreductase [Nitrospirae bacterium CG_4_10_14_0_8_um_filter_41_23]|nr:pyruvate ferredoxin oxidoreductase [Nitrospirota bacterium]OIP58697.1 MAG: pyruvate ferredoxin oxidoreductase [Nitrospirae bacterium CG2_30_41_42]PIQ94717.1 MAG: pyruvate ferredoxin oxidoreductase [Nitrospirae bacterium CG11_big_fil_rev_8_21_14_0_20_41_14]PIV44767.1 MAG: pyruvate ferredoxin oxidoreductase [Nitrospirae bacterium CG02_land_8_20_14_3_00_41_53]PIW87373.1 MAG: pyruvate ferredoxin oxidoreductase [Nitrospirae bacterium CG_4_8_14_3_um_filter_41_47]PIY86004.1 MAG: pyruvate ferredoxi
MARPLSLKEISKKEVLISSGHRMCAGCGAPTVIKMVLLASDYPIIAATATGCLEVSTCISDYTAWKIPWIHSAFENAAATISGVETMYRSLKKQGVISKEIKFVAFGGDGGTYDIGLQSLSGAVERGHDMLYICYDNQAYMNTGIQRSSATPRGADTTTMPAGSVVPGKTEPRKNLTRIMAAHDLPYAAQASPSHWMDLMKKVRKAFDIKGPKFMNILSPCNRGWRSRTDEAIMLSRLAVETCHWPLYEVEYGVTKITFKPKEKKPIVDFLKPQGRFKHLFKPENEWMIKKLQEDIDREWERLQKEASLSAP